MPCDVPAHAFDHIPEVQAVHLADRYILVLSAGQVVGRNAATQALYGWAGPMKVMMTSGMQSTKQVCNHVFMASPFIGALMG